MFGASFSFSLILNLIPKYWANWWWGNGGSTLLWQWCFVFHLAQQWCFDGGLLARRGDEMQYSSSALLNDGFLSSTMLGGGVSMETCSRDAVVRCSGGSTLLSVMARETELEEVVDQGTMDESIPQTRPKRNRVRPNWIKDYEMPWGEWSRCLSLL